MTTPCEELRVPGLRPLGRREADDRVRRGEARPRGRHAAGVQGRRRGRLEPRGPARRLRRLVLRGHARRDRRAARHPAPRLGVAARGRVARRNDGRTGFVEATLDVTLTTEPGREEEAIAAAEAAERGCLVAASLDVPVRLALDVRAAEPSRGGSVTGIQPSASFSATLRVRLENRPGTFARARRGDRRGRRAARRDRPRPRRARHEDPRRHRPRRRRGAPRADRRRRARASTGSRSINVSDRTFLHAPRRQDRDRAKSPLKTRDDLSMAYTPGVARVSSAIADDPAKVWNLTIKQHTVAVVTDGTAVLGLGDIGPEARAPGDGGQGDALQGVRRRRRLPDLPRDEGPGRDRRDREGDRARSSAASTSRTSPRRAASRSRSGCATSSTSRSSTTTSTGRRSSCSPRSSTRSRSSARGSEDLRVVVTGVGAAGVAVTKMLLAAGVRDIVGCDRERRVHRGRPGLTPAKAAYAELTNPNGLTRDRRRGAGRRRRLRRRSPAPAPSPSRRSARWRRTRSSSRWPTRRPRSCRRRSPDCATVIGTGRSDYPNQINNVLAFPGIFRGALDVRASEIDEEMKLAAADGDRRRSSSRTELEAGLRDPERLQPRGRARGRRGGRPRGRGVGHRTARPDGVEPD